MGVDFKALVGLIKLIDAKKDVYTFASMRLKDIRSNLLVLLESGLISGTMKQVHGKSRFVYRVTFGGVEFVNLLSNALFYEAEKDELAKAYCGGVVDLKVIRCKYDEHRAKFDK